MVSFKETVEAIERAADFLRRAEMAMKVALRYCDEHRRWNDQPDHVYTLLSRAVEAELPRLLAQVRRQLFGALVRAEQVDALRAQADRERAAQVVDRFKLGLPGSRRVEP